MTQVIKVAEAYSRTPGGRFVTDGPYSGERFRDDFLAPALKRHSSVEVDLTGVFGYGSSFLEEAFGGLVRKGFFTKTDLRSRLSIKSALKTYELKVWQYINDAKPENSNAH